MRLWKYSVTCLVICKKIVFMENKEYDLYQTNRNTVTYPKYSKLTLLPFYLSPGYPGNLITFLHYSLQAPFVP